MCPQVNLTLPPRANHISSYSVALVVQIRLSQNRTDLALKEVLNAKRWAQDSLLVNLAESWVGLRIVSLSLRGESVRFPSLFPTLQF